MLRRQAGYPRTIIRLEGKAYPSPSIRWWACMSGWRRLPLRLPCAGPSTISKVKGLTSTSLPVRTMFMEVFHGMLRDWVGNRGIIDRGDRQNEGLVDRHISIVDRNRDGGAAILVGSRGDVDRAVRTGAAQRRYFRSAPVPGLKRWP